MSICRINILLLVCFDAIEGSVGKQSFKWNYFRDFEVMNPPFSSIPFLYPLILKRVIIFQHLRLISKLIKNKINQFTIKPWFFTEFSYWADVVCMDCCKENFDA